MNEERTCRITAVTAHRALEGMRVSCTYSIVDSEGKLISSNNKFTRLVMDEDIGAAISIVYDWLTGLLQEGGNS